MLVCPVRRHQAQLIANVRGTTKMLRTSILLVGFLSLLLSCASPSQNKKIHSEQMDANMERYIKCMEKATALYLSANANPYEVADAAQSKCSSEYHAYERSTEQYLTSDRTTRGGVVLAKQNARDLAQEIKTLARQKVVQWVIEGRAQHE